MRTVRHRSLLTAAIIVLNASAAFAQLPETPARTPGATVSGVVHDSLARAPLAGAWVQLVAADGAANAPRTVVSDTLGRFAFDGVPDGRYTIGFFHPLLDSLGVAPPLRAVRVRRGRPERIDLAIPSPARLRAAVCGGPVTPGLTRTSGTGAGALIAGVVRDASDSASVVHVTVSVEWLELTLSKSGWEPLRLRTDAATDTAGRFFFCNAPRGGTVSLSVTRGADSTRRMDIQVPATGFLRADLYVGTARTLTASDTTPLSLRQVVGRTGSEGELRAGADSAIREFQLLWRYAWQDAQRVGPTRWNPALNDDRERFTSAHCHPFYPPIVPAFLRKRIIVGAMPSQAMCPKWYSSTRPMIGDERRAIDAGLIASVRPGIKAFRSQLRSLLDTTARQIPGDVHIAGQRVRFAIDQGDFAGAKAAATACERDLAQCALLRAYVRYRAGDIGGADSAFLAAANLMSEADRCAFNDIGMLLDAVMRRTYRALSCAARAGFEANLWLLSDPLYIEPGNERRAEHFARKMMLALMAPLGEDGRWRMTPEKGGEATTETLVRYGWPSQLYWGGPEVDRGHDTWLEMYSLDTAPPYVVPEYTRSGRLHAVPSTGALQAPFRAKPDDWELYAPANDEEWWPTEHMARDRSRIVQLPVGQTAMFRRKNSIRFAWAGDLDAVTLGVSEGDSVHAGFFQAREGSDVTRVGSYGGILGQPFVVDAPLLPGVALIGIELPGDSAHAAARTRFGIETPTPLSAQAGDLALSQPLLFDPALDARSSLDADAAVRRMYGTTTFTKWRRIGVYWEAYGFAPADAVDIEVQMVREDRPGILVRVTGFFLLGRGEGGKATLRWREEPGSSAAIHRLEGSVPVQMRSINLDISRLPRGHYQLQLSMKRDDGAAVTSERAFVLR
jgi:hypothetical protein